MKLFPIILAALAVVVGFATTFGLLVMQWPRVLSAKPPPPSGVVTPPRDWDFWTIAIQELSEELRLERAAVAARQADLDTLAARIAAERAEIEHTREQIAAIQKEIQNTVITLLETERPNLRSLSKSYSSMRPAQAVKILQNMNDDMVVKILSLMKPDTVGAILGAMALEPAPTPDPSAPPPPQGFPQTPDMEALANPTPTPETGSARAARLSELLRLLKLEKPPEQ